jgi:3-hydroxyisobutyrate dehydrogenase-like beta-hydroxyacid dehydrogenase
MGKRAREIYEAFDGAGNGTRDFSAIVETLN